MALGLGALSLTACGSREADPRTWGRAKLEQQGAVGEGSGSKTPTGTGSPKGSGKGDTGTSTPDPNAPLDTFLQEGLVLPSRLKAETLTVSFRSNVQGASFECAKNSSLVFTPCDGSSYSFGRLAHGQSYMVRVRARTADGRFDATPLVVSFVADLLTGSAPETAAPVQDVDAIVPESAADLPQPVAAGGSTSTAGRALQVGSYFAVVAPADQQVTSYASNKNYALRQQYFRLSSEKPCTGTFEREVPGPAGSNVTYCEATPNDGEWASVYSRGEAPVARNHVEMIRSSPEGVEEQLLVAAFDREQDPAELKLGLATRCVGSNYQGQTQVPLLSTFYGEVETELLHWCQARDEQGEWWWVGSFAAIVSRNPNPARLTVVYAVNVRQGLFSGPQFATYAERRLPRLIIPIALPSGTP